LDPVDVDNVASAASVADKRDVWFNVLIDPWLTGPQADFHKRFNQQWHVIKSCVENVNELGVRIHAVIVSHEFTDHCHKATLEQVDPTVPVYATTVCFLPACLGDE